MSHRKCHQRRSMSVTLQANSVTPEQAVLLDARQRLLQSAKRATLVELALEATE